MASRALTSRLSSLAAQPKPRSTGILVGDCTRPNIYREGQAKVLADRTSRQPSARLRVVSRALPRYYSTEVQPTSPTQSLPVPDELYPLPEASKLRQYMILPNNQRVCFDEYGRPDGIPIVWLHGYPACGVEAAGLHAMCWRLGLRIISPDRPGLGRSSSWSTDTQLTSNYDVRPDFYPINEYPAHIAALAYLLGLGDFAIVGGSGGGPYAVSCANSLQQHLDAYSEDDLRKLFHANQGVSSSSSPDGSSPAPKTTIRSLNVDETVPKLLSSRPHLAACGVLAGVGPYDTVRNSDVSFAGRAASYIAEMSPLLGRLMVRSMQRSSRQDLDKMAASLRKQFSKLPLERARKIMTEEPVLQHIALLFQLSNRRGWGMWTEARINNNAKGWGFELQDVRFAARDGSGLHLWYGDLDSNCPLSHGRAIADRVPGAQLHVFHGEDHFSLEDDRIEDVLIQTLATMGHKDPKHCAYSTKDPERTYLFRLNQLLQQREAELDKAEPGKPT